MELNFTELTDNNLGTAVDNTDANNFENYWEQKETTQKKKKKVSFDDILSNMNIVVNKSGVLQYMAPLQEMVEEQPHYEQLEPAVKHSYIYNKYFKDYQDAQAPPPQVRTPKTMEEYKKMLLEDKIERIKQQKRISEIKSTKLLFTTNPVYTGQQRNIRVSSSSNNLRKLNFH